MPKKSILVILLLLELVWIPVYFKLYDISMAVMLTLSFIVAGYIGDKVLKMLSKKKAHDN